MGMKRSTIKMLLRKKINAWLTSIEADSKLGDAQRLNLTHAITQDTIVTGGAIASMLLGEPINDYDIYFKTVDTAEKVARYYTDRFNRSKGTLKTRAMHSCNPIVKRVVKTNIKGEDEERVIVYIKSAGVAGTDQSEYRYFESEVESSSDEFIMSLTEGEDQIDLAETLLEDMHDMKEKFNPIFFSENAITLSDKMQLVMRFTGQPRDIHKNYDFIHTTCSYDYNADRLLLPNEALESLLSKSLIYHGSLYPLASMFRVRKFLARGWRITAGQMLKMAHQISELDLNDRNVLQDQLVGVDAAYMHQLLVELQKAKGRIDATYLAKLIDEIFE